MAVRAAAEEFGTYVLAAEDRADMMVRVDTLLDDPGYYRRFYGSIVEANGGIAPPEPEAVPPDLFPRVLGETFGPAATKALLDIQRSMAVLLEWRRWIADHVPAAVLADADRQQRGLSPTLPLDNLSAFPMPVARGMLASLRTDALFLAAMALMVRPSDRDPWIRHAVLEEWASELREQLVLCASIGKVAVPLDLVPAERRFDVPAASRAFARAQQAYAQFTADAERSGEPIYPART